MFSKFRTLSYVLISTVLALIVTGQTSGQYDHDRFQTRPIDIERQFIAFVVSFDGPDEGVALAVPEWVAYELRAKPPNLGSAPARPGSWTTDHELSGRSIAPSDSSYGGSGYSRGHMCMKSHAHRMSAEADRETHTLLNACPQLQEMNGGVWLSLENLTGHWADVYERVWIVTGPVFLSNLPRRWIGDAGEVPVAVPDMFFKIVIRDTEGGPSVLAFLIPMEGDDSHSKASADVRPYLTSVDIIEAITGLDFLTVLADSIENDIEKRIATTLWDTDVPALAQRPPPIAVESESRAPAASPTNPLDGVTLRDGVQASATDTALAKKLKLAGWEYFMPRPKSAQAAWGNSDGRTTWWNGYWKNSKTGKYSSRQPSESE